MKVEIIKEVFNGQRLLHVGEILQIIDKTAKIYIQKGIAKQVKEAPAKKEQKPAETKENKAVSKRVTKSAK